MPNYAVDDAQGNRLTAGLQEYNALAVARQIATDRGESVYLYVTGENEAAGEPIEIEPEQ